MISRKKCVAEKSWNFQTAQKKLVKSIKNFALIFSFFTFAIGGTLFLLAQCVLIFGWTCLYFKHKKLKTSDFPNPMLDEPYRDYDPYLTNIFRDHHHRDSSSATSTLRETSNDSTPDSSLDLHSLNQRQLILKHLDYGGSRKP